MKTNRSLFNMPGVVLLLLSQSPGTGSGLLKRARELQLTSSEWPYRVIAGLEEAGLIRFAGNAKGQGGGKRYMLTEAGREVVSGYRQILAIAASRFPADTSA